jgi:hypothetical protein
MSILRFAIALALTLGVVFAGPSAAQDRSPSGRTDESVDVTRGTRFRLESVYGAVTVRGWDKDIVRVQARHTPNDRISVRRGRNVVSVTDESEHGRSGRVDYDIDLPRWMPVSIELTFDNITIDGVESDVAVETVRGQVSIKGGRGSVRAESVEGHVIIDGAQARVEASSVNDYIQIQGVTGEVSTETTNGAITMSRMQSSTVEASTVNGSISYEGTIADDGHYTLSTHNGDISVAIPERSNLSLDVRTYNGGFSSDLPVKGTAPARRGGHATYVLGSGAAQMELESFGGTIKVRNGGSAERGTRREP